MDWIHITIRLGCTLDGKQLGAVKRQFSSNSIKHMEFLAVSLLIDLIDLVTLSNVDFDVSINLLVPL